ncbi:DNA polymerase III subunit gamma/tau [Cryobacterium melibiosiphilum]|uniref:DNA polymerase III subunit gamma/tau n=1 Tax=Cryobacterium melibiosiphilum TaxID=995039 RepID=A0A3A5MJJ3_9MICO|nr:DNA polymerase III subunit gamma/tau [Cryobacterium melibiosiphilum]RJT84774.1 DNA polymerase III subunit gamma/tau [Cryobacterium melibiosiphilum]
MNAKSDDDALSWAGENDPTLAPGDTPSRPELADGWSTPATPSTTPDGFRDDSRAVTGPQAAQVASAGASATLVIMGILAGVYLLYTIGWFIGVNRITNPIADPVSEFMFSLGAWLAVAAPIVWFGVTYWLTASRPRIRLLWLLLGVVLLAPVPFIFGSGAGA